MTWVPVMEGQSSTQLNNTMVNMYVHKDGSELFFLKKVKCGHCPTSQSFNRAGESITQFRDLSIQKKYGASTKHGRLFTCPDLLSLLKCH